LPQPRELGDGTKLLRSGQIKSKSSSGHHRVEISGRFAVDMAEAFLVRWRPADHGAVPGRTVDVVKYGRLEFNGDVFQHFHGQHPVVARQPVLRQRQVQKRNLYTSYVVINRVGIIQHSVSGC